MSQYRSRSVAPNSLARCLLRSSCTRSLSSSVLSQSSRNTTSSTGIGIGRSRVAPAAVAADEGIGFGRPPAAALVRNAARMVHEDGIDDRPCGLDCIFASEERFVARHGVAQQAFVRSFAARLLVGEVELALVADEILAGALHAG